MKSWCLLWEDVFQIVKLLIDRGANINQTTTSSSTALRGACFDGHLEVGESLSKYTALLQYIRKRLKNNFVFRYVIF